MDGDLKIKISSPKKTRKKISIFALFLIIAILFLSLYFGQKFVADFSTSAYQSAVLSAKKPAAEVEINLPTEDVPGEDLVEFLRYPNSVRTYFSQSEDQKTTILGYQTKAGAEDILKFYRDDLIKKQWLLKEENSDSLTFAKNGSSIMVTVKSLSKTINVYQASIYLEPATLPLKTKKR